MLTNELSTFLWIMETSSKVDILIVGAELIVVLLDVVLTEVTVLLHFLLMLVGEVSGKVHFL